MTKQHNQPKITTTEKVSLIKKKQALRLPALIPNKLHTI